MAEQQRQVEQGSEDVDDDSGRRRRQLRILEPVRMRLNITSVIDVVFLLLIYFMVTASFSQGEGSLKANLPQGGPVKQSENIEPPRLPLRIFISSVGAAGYRIAVQGVSRHPEDFKYLGAILESLQYHEEKNPQGVYAWDTTPVIIHGDGMVRWQHVVNAFNAAVKAGYKNIAFERVSR